MKMIRLVMVAVVMIAALAMAPAAEAASYTALTVAAVADTGTSPTWASADTSNGNKFQNDGQTFLLARNYHADTTATLTILTGATVGGLAVADRTVTVAPGATKLIGPFNKAIYDQPGATDAGAVAMTVANGTALKLFAFR